MEMLARRFLTLTDVAVDAEGTAPKFVPSAAIWRKGGAAYRPQIADRTPARTPVLPSGNPFGSKRL